MSNILKTIKDFVHCMSLFEVFKLTQNDDDFEKFRKAIAEFIITLDLKFLRLYLERKNGSSLCIASFISVQFFEANITLYNINEKLE